MVTLPLVLALPLRSVYVTVIVTVGVSVFGVGILASMFVSNCVRLAGCLSVPTRAC